MPDVMIVTVSVQLQKVHQYQISKHKRIKIRALNLEQPTAVVNRGLEKTLNYLIKKISK